MVYDSLANLFANSTALQLITRKNAPLILSFLQESFKQDAIRTRSNTELTSRLARLLEEIDYKDEDEDINSSKLFDDYDAKAMQYMERWSNAGFLRKYPNELGEEVHELTADSEKVLLWLQSLKRREFVGTESRFKDIFTRLKDLISQTEVDPEKRLQELEDQKHEIEKKIMAIRVRGHLASEDVYDDTKIKERFYELDRAARELLTDFTEVEQNFEGLRRDIQRRYMEQDTVKGDLLRYVLDALHDLDSRDQGKSFKAFWKFLLDEATKEEFDSLTAKLYELLHARGIDAGADRFLKHLKRYLLVSGKKVVDANGKLSEKLNRILSERNPRERKRILELIADIRAAAICLPDIPPRDDVFLILETVPVLNLPTRWELAIRETEASTLQYPDATEVAEPESAALAALFKQSTVDRARLQARIDKLLEDREQIGLEELVRYQGGIEQGLGELVGYLSIALQGDHLVLESSAQTIPLGDRMINMPTVIFIKPRAAGAV